MVLPYYSTALPQTILLLSLGGNDRVNAVPDFSFCRCPPNRWRAWHW